MSQLLPQHPELPLKAIKMPLYPSYDSLAEAILAIESQAPLTNPNQVFIALMTYHNSLIKVIEDGANFQTARTASVSQSNQSRS